MLHYLLIFIFLSVAVKRYHCTIVTGFIIDYKCWNLPNHVGIDGTNLETNPGGHILHCLYCCGCPASGYALLEESAPSVYRIKYQLDSIGNSLMQQLALDEEARGGDRAFNELITIQGDLTSSVGGGTIVINVETLRFTPTVNNAGNIEICHGECSPMTVTSTTSNVPAPGVAASSTTTTADRSSSTAANGAITTSDAGATSGDTASSGTTSGATADSVTTSSLSNPSQSSGAVGWKNLSWISFLSIISGMMTASKS